jgi:hypothetical protein
MFSVGFTAPFIMDKTWEIIDKTGKTASFEVLLQYYSATRWRGCYVRVSPLILARQNFLQFSPFKSPVMRHGEKVVR